MKSFCLLDNGKMVSTIKTRLKLWTIFDNIYQCDYTFEDSHEKSITKVIKLTKSRIASCSEDSSSFAITA